MSWFGYLEDPFKLIFTISPQTQERLYSSAKPFEPGRHRAAWGWTLEDQKVIPTLLVVFGLAERAIAYLIRWSNATQAPGKDQTALRSLTKIILEENLLIAGGDLGRDHDLFAFPMVSVLNTVAESGLHQYKAMMTFRHHLQAPIDFLDSGKTPQNRAFNFPIFDDSIFPPPKKNVLGGGFSVY
jgi:hypothetical protein